MNPLAANGRNQILTELFNSTELNKMLAKHDAGAGNDDLKSELMTVLCTQPFEKIEQLHTDKQLMYFATGIVRRMIFQKGSKFHRTYRKTSLEFNDSLETEDICYDHERDSKESKVMEVIDKELHWVERSMLGIYLEKGSMYKASQDTGISIKQVKNIIKKARGKINTSMNGKLLGNYIVANMEFVIDVNTEVTPETIIDLMDEVQDYIEYKLAGTSIPTKTKQDAFVKEIKGIRVKKII